MSSQGAALNVPIIQLQLRFTHNRETEEISPADCIISTQGRRRDVNAAKEPGDVARRWIHGGSTSLALAEH